ncbi:MAG TPA: PRC-barrel domain-containing protein [Armatimonadota bacterium]|nr:PRC-barrel domain-containing protein [Armatimonadota bacterium]
MATLTEAPNRPTYRSYQGDYGTIPDDLAPLNTLDNFEIADGEFDPRGWDLLDRDGAKIGKIRNLLVSPTTLESYFAVVEGVDRYTNRYFAVPMARLRLDRGNKNAISPYVLADFEQAPVFSEEQPLYSSYYSYWNGVRR